MILISEAFPVGSGVLSVLILIRLTVSRDPKSFCTVLSPAAGRQRTRDVRVFLYVRTTGPGRPPSVLLWVQVLLSWGRVPVPVLLQDPSRPVRRVRTDRNRRRPSEEADLRRRRGTRALGGLRFPDRPATDAYGGAETPCPCPAGRRSAHGPPGTTHHASAERPDNRRDLLLWGVLLPAAAASLDLRCPSLDSSRLGRRSPLPGHRTRQGNLDLRAGRGLLL